MKEHFRKVFNRIFLTVIIILFQIAWWTLLVMKLMKYSDIIEVISVILSLAMVVYLISKDDNPEYRIIWIVLILLSPLFGGLLYLSFGDKKPSKRLRRKFNLAHNELKKFMPQDNDTLERLEEMNIRAAQTSKYITNYSDYPVWTNTETTYYKVGEEMYEDMLEELEKAEHFIFLEYFIIQEGKMWDSILEILVRKAAMGVEVRVIYDDIGSVATLPPQYDLYIESLGTNIHCLAFNPFVPIASLVMNNRDHRKIMVIDGKVAFNGGINLSDEYINENSRFGHWKDTGVRIKGEAVWNFTLMFLETWRAYRKDDEDIMKFKTEPLKKDDRLSNGFVQPFCDTPLENEPIAENVYIEILNQAERYVYIYTPYLIIDYEMLNALCLAVKRGVDVRIVTPGIPDKKIIYRLTRSNYTPLLKAGVKIYEYLPGFIHAKSYVCDDKFAVVGSINMDYRSLYLHFECGTYMYKTSAIQPLKEDCLETFEKSYQVTLEDRKQRIIGRIIDALLRVLSPLL
ncbi:putative uncharacterized protein [Eubacterium sp. CAG:603]|jgi:Phosphatidylserine/phosphatidylglycerophosphate/cardiolipin synthases and related enzymes|nr:putative uncharacterized protein [Eubacterium sp. CAG:603]